MNRAQFKEFTRQAWEQGAAPSCGACLWLQGEGDCTAIRIETGPGQWEPATQPCMNPGQCQYYSPADAGEEGEQ